MKIYYQIEIECADGTTMLAHREYASVASAKTQVTRAIDSDKWSWLSSYLCSHRAGSGRVSRVSRIVRVTGDNIETAHEYPCEEEE